MKFSTVIFDMDGTLVDNIQYHKDAWIFFLTKNGIMIAPEKFHAENHGTISEMITRFFGKDISEERIVELGQEKELCYRELYRNHIEEIKGLTPLLQKLKAMKVKIGLATMGDLPNINFIVDTLGIRSYFDCIMGGHEIIKGKPDPEIFLSVAQKLEVNPQECLVFEDSLGGVLSAKRAGMKVIGLSTTEEPDYLLEHGCMDTIHDFEEFDLAKITWS